MNQSEHLVRTHFAPAGRETSDQLEQSAISVRNAPLLQRTIDAMHDAVLILNPLRQVVAANQAVIRMLDCSSEQVLGRRPGELVGCKNAAAGPDGCGTSPECVTCGAVNAILESQRTEDRVTRECRIALEEPVGGAMDLNVSATAVAIDGQRFTICILKDISDEKRLAVLTRTFFHDVINTAGGIRGFVELLRETVATDSTEQSELADLQELAEQLVDEIEAQRDLTYAESGDLQPDLTPVSVPRLLDQLQALYSRHPVAHGRHLTLGDVWPGSVQTDRRLLGRVLGNMIKNALEATAPGGTVRVSCHEPSAGEVQFAVHNDGVMPDEVQMQIFQRSFSTKGEVGRGIGTHSMKLFGERYLGGKVAFISRLPEGTTFTLALPESGPAEHRT